jgi:hypothetical protein
MSMSMRTTILLGTVLAMCLPPLAAQAHWCNDMWSSSYNIVVRPASDTVTVPSSGSGSLDIFVQNNMGYLLPNFKLTATMGSGTVAATRQTQKVTGTLLPGENAKFTLAISKSGGGAVAIGDISFAVSFGDSGQSGLYGASPGKAVMIRQTNGTLVPSPPPPGIGTGADQSRQHQYAALADFSDVNSGLDKLMGFYCAGRGSWGANDATVITTACSGTATDCTKATRSTAGTGSGTKYDYTKLWAAVELAARKSALGTRLATLRTRLQCGAADSNVGFAGLAMMVLGYLGDDPTARTFLEGKAGTSDIGTIAKAALMLMSAADVTKYQADVKAGLSKGGFVGPACAAALGIATLDDASVNSTLVPAAKWNEPDTGDNGQSLFASHMLALTAWDRRCWAAQGADSGPVTFYTGATPARTCNGTPGTGGSPGTGGTTGNGGTTGTGGTMRTGGSMVTGGSVATGGTSAAGGTTARGGTTATPTGGSTSTPTGGSGVTPTGGSGVTPTGGSGVTPTGGSGVTPTGGSGVTPTGGSGVTPTGGSAVTPTGGSAVTPTGGKAVTPTGGKAVTPTGGNAVTPTGGSAGAGPGGQGGNGVPPSSGTAKSGGSAGGCGYAPSGRATIPLGFLLAGVGLALAARRRRR